MINYSKEVIGRNLSVSAAWKSCLPNACTLRAHTANRKSMLRFCIAWNQLDFNGDEIRRNVISINAELSAVHGESADDLHTKNSPENKDKHVKKVAEILRTLDWMVFAIYFRRQTHANSSIIYYYYCGSGLFFAHNSVCSHNMYLYILIECTCWCWHNGTMVTNWIAAGSSCGSPQPPSKIQIINTNANEWKYLRECVFSVQLYLQHCVAFCKSRQFCVDKDGNR